VKINVIVVDEDVDRGVKAGRHMRNGLAAQMRGFEMHVHVRLSDTKTTDDAYAKYTG
jgi:hypothetical protein